MNRTLQKRVKVLLDIARQCNDLAEAILSEEATSEAIDEEEIRVISTTYDERTRLSSVEVSTFYPLTRGARRETWRFGDSEASFQLYDIPTRTCARFVGDVTAIAHSGACIVPTELTVQERKFQRDFDGYDKARNLGALPAFFANESRRAVEQELPLVAKKLMAQCMANAK